jgi:hypothetical protein
MLKVEVRPVGRWWEAKIVVDDGLRIEMPGLLDDREMAQLAQDLRDAAESLARFLPEMEAT